MAVRESGVSVRDVVLKTIGPVRVVELTATAASYGREDVGPVLRALFPELYRRMAANGVRPERGPRIAYYEDPAVPSDAVIVHAAMPVMGRPAVWRGVAVAELPAVPLAATIIHRGGMDSVTASLWHLADWIEAAGYVPVGYHREVYYALEPGVTELQVGVVRPARG
jgi:effector-binding domain-containing protein